MGATSLFELPDDSPAKIRRKRSLLDQLRSHRRNAADHIAADLWCAAFFTQLNQENLQDGAIPMTNHVVLAVEGRLQQGPAQAQAEALSRRLRFFHWPLEFPEVFSRGGFDVILCNPPWEMIQLEEQEFFSTRNLEIASAVGAARQAMIQQLRNQNSELWQEYCSALHDTDSLRKFLRSSESYPLTGSGRVNTYSVFAERFTHLLRPEGRVGAVLPTGIATDHTNKDFFAKVASSGRLVSLYDFENREAIFPGVHRSYKFCLLTLRGTTPASREHAEFAFFLTRAEHLRDKQRVFTLDPGDFALLNPNTRTCPIFRTRADADLTKLIYRRVPVLINEHTKENPWGISFKQGMFNMTTDSRLFRTREQLENEGFRLSGNRFVKGTEVYLPLYEAKMIHQFNHRFGDCAGLTNRPSNAPFPKPSASAYQHPVFTPQPWYWIPNEALPTWARSERYFLAYRRIARATDERTLICSILPTAGCGDPLPVVQMIPSCATTSALLLSAFNSVVLDYVVRQKIGGIHLDFHYFKQLPIPSVERLEDAILHVFPETLELTCTAWDIQPFFDDVWREADDQLRAAIRRQWEENRQATGGHTYDPPEWYTPPKDPCPLPPFKWGESRRARLRAELDAYFAKLYGLNRKQLRYILDPADLTPKEIETITTDYEEVSDPLDPAGYDARVRASTFPGETFRVLKEKELRLYGEYRTRRLILEAWERHESDLQFHGRDNHGWDLSP